MDIRVPQLAEGITTGTVVSIIVKPGEVIAAGQTVLELETEKAIAPVPASAGGKVVQILVKEGDKVAVGQAVVRLEGAAGAEPAQPVPAPQAAPAQAAAAPVYAPAAAPAPATPGAIRGAALPVPEGFDAPASPSLRKTARALGIDLRRVQGTGGGGRILESDVRAYIQELQRIVFSEQPGAAPQPAAPRVPPLPDFSKQGPVTRQPMSLLRKKIAEKMALSWENVVHVTQFDEAEITRLNALRKQYKAAYEQKGGRLTVTVLLVKAVANVLTRYKEFNASIDLERQEIVYKEFVNIGLAVDTEQGLIVPVIKDAAKKSALELSVAIQSLAEKARARSVGLEELQGGTFTISNQGGIGGTHFTPIVNWPEVAILGLGQSRERCVLREGKAQNASFLPLALSYDHRLIDGGSAARFIAELVKEIETFDEAALALK